MEAEQWRPGMSVPEGHAVYLVLITGTDLYSYNTPDQRGPVGLGLWLAPSREAACRTAVNHFGWPVGQHLNNPVPVALDVGPVTL